MKLLTKELEVRFPALYATEKKRPEKIKIIAKFFDPSSQWTWYVTEYDPVKRVFFGLVRGIGAEMGYFSLDDLETVKGRMGLGIERERHFGKHTLAEALEKPI
ncbi:MAG: DUF2958 domain-containing protein [Candidatus Omnitrophota bacterium]